MLPSKFDKRNNPEYLNEAFQRTILRFILDNRRENFMNCTIDSTLRTAEEIPQGPQVLSSTRSLDTDAAERDKEAKRRRLDT